MSFPKLGLSDSAISRVASLLQPSAPVAVETTSTLRFASYEAAKTGLARSGFEPIGSAMYRKAHALWQLNKGASGYSLMRVAAEPDTFEEDLVKEAPGPHVDKKLKMGTRDRYGVDVRVGDHVQYSLGGNFVEGRVVRASHGHVDVRFANQLDAGVPAHEIVIDRNKRAEFGAGEGDTMSDAKSDSESGPFDNDSMGLHINPEKTAELVAAHFASYGGVLADQMDAPLSTDTVQKLNATADAMKTCEKCKGSGCEACVGRKATRVASWEAISKVSSAPTHVLDGICHVVSTGVSARRLAKSANIPFAIAFDLYDDLRVIPTRDVRAIFATAKNVRTASAMDASYASLSQHLGESFASHIVAHIQGFQQKRLSLQRIAADQTAEDYWTAYFGEYGEQWVREVKRRIKADLVREALLKNAVDETAADYWSNYYGEYGDKLTDEVDRASKKKTVSASRVPMNASAPPMPLPQPVPRRDIFANVQIVAEESFEGNRVALAKTATGGLQLLVRSGNAQKSTPMTSTAAAYEEFGKAVRMHCGF